VVPAPVLRRRAERAVHEASAAQHADEESTKATHQT
jgi:hypothetical protein